MIKDVSKQWAAILESDEAADAAYGIACEEACNEADEIKEAEINNFDEEEVSLEECGLADSEEGIDEAEEITEADEAAAEKKATKAFDEVKKETKDVEDVAEVKDYFEKNKADIKKNIAKFKDPETRARLEKILKIIEKVANGEVKIGESELDEAKAKSAPVQFLKGAIRLFVWILKIAPLALIGTAWVGKKIGQASKWVLDKADKSLAEDEPKEIEEDEVIDADGVSVKEADMSMIHQGKSVAQWEKEFNGEFTADQIQRMAMSGTDLQRLLLTVNGQSSLDDSEKPVNEADYREPAAHLLDPVGVNASTANLKAQDTAMIGVVETLLKKIDKLEDRLDEACKKDKKEEKLDEAEESERKHFEIKFKKNGQFYTYRMKYIGKDIESLFKDHPHLVGKNIDIVSVTVDGRDCTEDAQLTQAMIEQSSKQGFEEAEKLDEYGHQRYDLSSKDGTVSKALKNHIAEWTPQILQNQQHAAEVIKGWFDEEGVDTPYTQKMLKEIAFFPKFRNINNIIMYLNNVMQSGMGNKMTYGKKFESEDAASDDTAKLAEEMMEDAVEEADTQLDDEVDADYPEFDEKGLTPEQRKDYEAAVRLQDKSYEKELTKAEEDEFRSLLDKLPEIAKDYLLSNTMGKAGFARPGNHVVLPNGNKMPVDDGGGPLNGGKVHYTGEYQEIAPFRYQQNPEDVFQKASLAKRAQKAAEEAAKKNKKIEIPMRGQDVWAAEDWTKMYNSMDKQTQKSWLEDVIKDIRDEYKDDSESAELQIAMLKRAVGKKITDDDIKDLIVGLTGKQMTKQGAGKRANLYAKAIRMAFVTAMDKSLASDVKQKILQGIKIPGATGLSAIGIPDKLLVKMSDAQFDKFLKNIRIQIDAIQKRKGGSFKAEEPTDDELAAIEAGDDTAGEVKAESTEQRDELTSNGDSINEDEVTDMNKFFEA